MKSKKWRIIKAKKREVKAQSGYEVQILTLEKNETIITSREGIVEMYNNLSFLRRLYVWNKKRAYWGTPANISKWSKAVIKSNEKYTCPWGNGITTW